MATINNLLIYDNRAGAPAAGEATPPAGPLRGLGTASTPEVAPAPGVIPSGSEAPSAVPTLAGGPGAAIPPTELIPTYVTYYDHTAVIETPPNQNHDTELLTIINKFTKEVEAQEVVDLDKKVLEDLEKEINILEKQKRVIELKKKKSKI
ncbi:hypothetical protein C1645_834121 [Glomus cerebriforme]|uniref:Uncharacterized protein n=1 Tax=Glomus cerebriforme TaxID=658196 RepID=A0A397SCK6_9GLOM|nr:hypothetical protein C1645_834121 [Glomus cerebriforme]